MKLIVMAALVITTIEAMKYHEVASQCPSSRRNFENLNRIQYGKITNITEWPFMVRLLTCKSDVLWVCGGTVITKHHILTAAHCVFDEKTGKYFTPSNVWVGFGHSHWRKMDYTNVGEIYVHEFYIGKASHYENDIAVVVVDRIPKEAAQKPVHLLTERFELNSKQLTILGWGLMENGRGSDVLRKATMPGIESRWGKRGMICLEVIRSDTGSGDSGGPILFKNSNLSIQVGVFSHFNERCDFQTGEIINSSSCFADISAYIPWIAQKIEESDYKEKLKKSSAY